MRRLAIACGAALLLPAVAGAKAVKPVCLQITDATGDGVALGLAAAPSLDVLSADIATGPRNLVVAVRMKTLQRDPYLAGGVTYEFSWRAGGVKQVLVYEVYANGDTVGTFEPAASPTSAVPAQAVADPSTSTITWTISRKTVAALRRSGATFSELTVMSHVADNLSGGSHGYVGVGDTASTARPYVDRTPTCLKGT